MVDSARLAARMLAAVNKAMERIVCAPRQDWKGRLEQHGFSFHSSGGEYWNESAAYRFSANEIDCIEDATAELQRLCLEAVERTVRTGRYQPFGLDSAACAWIERSWRSAQPALYGRFDLACDGAGSIKLLEFNGDTPTALIEAALSQWFWLQDLYPQADQFNSIHEKLIARWPRVSPPQTGELLHLAAMRGHVEDQATVTYLQDCAIQAGLQTTRIDIEDIGWSQPQRCFVDLQRRPIRRLFKLYPTEWLLADRFGQHLPQAGLQLIEPPWKLLLSSKAILPLLWEFFPEHPNLLPAYFGPAPATGCWAQKPVYSREGANISLLDDGHLFAQTGGGYGQGATVHQALAPLFHSDGRQAIVGSWVIGDEPAGIGLREECGPITRNSSLFVPHWFV